MRYIIQDNLYCLWNEKNDYIVSLVLYISDIYPGFANKKISIICIMHLGFTGLFLFISNEEATDIDETIYRSEY